MTAKSESQTGAGAQSDAHLALPSPRREIIPPDPQRSLRTIIHDFPSEICGWGAHPEYEVHLITKSQGSFIAGDHIGTFGPGHVSIMGPDLPHDWVSDLEPGEIIRDRDVVIHFSDHWIRKCMALIPELHELEPMLTRTHRGLVFSGATAWRAAALIHQVASCTGAERVSQFFHLMTHLSRAPEGDYSVVASPWLGRQADPDAQAAVEAALTYIFSNLTGDLRLGTAARLAYMSAPTFSKYFKAATGMTFSSMVKKLRIAHARRLLDTTRHSVGQVAARSGYRNMANFNRQFLEQVGLTPTQYRRLESSQKPESEVLSLGLRAGHDQADSH